MATLVLTAVGTLVGGPIGGAIGAILGGGIDQRLLGTSAKGPRLSDLSVQTSSYGNVLPKLFGALRVAGTVIWSTDLVEHKKKKSAGKGQPKVTTYSYTVSFAVALSGRRLRAVRRIWADGKLLRGAGGDWKSGIGAFRLHDGGEDQAPDPLIAAAQGLAATPAHRGTAYAVFEDLQLADFGNRIPSLTFEIEADDGAISIGAIATTLAGGAIIGGSAASFAGYAVAEESVRAALAAIAEVAPLALREVGGGLRLDTPDGPAKAIAHDALGSAADGRGAPARAFSRQAAGTLADEVTLAYYEPARDYQSGSQRARRDAGPARRSHALALAAALAPAQAKALAEARLAQDWAARATATTTLPWRWLDIRAGDIVTLPDEPRRWRVTAAGIEKMAVKLELSALPGPAAPLPPASGGVPVREPDAAAGTTILHLLDLPALEDALPSAPRLWIAACGSAPGWRGAGLAVSLDGGGRWDEIGGTAAPATIGTTMAALADGDPALRDRRATLDISLAHAAMALSGRDDLARNAGANLALIGDELVQFESAEPLGENRWRIGGLLRGRRGTEWATATHAPGERFVLLEPDCLLAHDPPASALGATASVMASGLGDGDEAVIASAVIVGRALRPPAPVRLRATRGGDGAITMGWRRRSRAGWAWLDGGDVPLGEEREAYALAIAPATGAARDVICSEPAFTYSAAMQAEDGSASATTLALSVAQQGALAGSLPPTTAMLSFEGAEP